MTEKTCHGLDLSLFDEVTFRFHVKFLTISVLGVVERHETGWEIRGGGTNVCDQGAGSMNPGQDGESIAGDWQVFAR